MKRTRTVLSLAWISVLILGLVLTACSGSPDNEIVYYEETKILTEEEAENIEEVAENRTRILFSETTAFVAGLEPGDILVSEGPVPGAEYGLLERVTGVSTTGYGFIEGVTGLTNGGTVVEIEPATMEDAIEEGAILVTETIPLEDLMNGAMWATGVEILQVHGGYDFSYSPAEGVTIEGYLLFTHDADVHIEASFWRGLQEFEFVFSPGLEMEATLQVEQGVEWDEKYTIATIPGPPIPIWGPVTITPEIELVVGTTGTVDASLEATVTYDRVYDVGLRYDGSWTTISDMRGEGATLEEPSFSGHGEALVFGGVVLSGTAGVSYVAEASLEAELLGNIRASGEIESSPWRWQYDLELYLSAQVFADLNLLRIAHVSRESDLWEYPDPPYNLAYGVSGRVTTEGGDGLDGVQINFSGGRSSVTTDVDGYWCKHLLSGEVEATPEKTGYVFDPSSITITGSASDLNLQAFGEEPRQYELTITSTAGGTVTTPGEGISTHDAGTVVDLVAEAGEDYQFVNWTGDVGSIANVNAAITTITMNGDYSITANFEAIPPEQFSLTITSMAGGTVTTPGEGISTHDAGTVVDLVAEAGEDYQFVNWTGDVGTISNVNGATTTITMNGDYSIMANFEEIPEYELTISSTAGGLVTTPGEGDFAYDAGTVVNLVATPASGYRFVNWTGDVGTISNVNAASTTVTMNSDYSITANFVQITPMVAAGWYHTVGLKSDGTVVAVGSSCGWECDVDGWTDIVEVAASGYHTVGLKSDGTVVAVGYNYDGQCNVGGWTDIIQVAAGGYHTLGVKSDGTVVAVGRNDYGQCDVGGWTDIIQVAADWYHTVGLKSDGTVVAVGQHYYGQCDVGGWTDIIQVAAGREHTVGLKSNGTVVAVGYWGHGQCSVGGWTDITQVAAGDFHTLGLKSDGTVVAVGSNSHGQCDVGGWTDITQVAAGGGHTVGLKTNGTVVAVGQHYYGQCSVGGWTDMTQVAAGDYHTLGLKTNGTVVAVGYNNHGQCDVGGWTDITQVAASFYQTVGLKTNGTVVAVGDNYSGKCDVGGWTDITQVAAGREHTVGLKSDGTVVAVGWNRDGQCDVGGWTDITQVAAGGEHTVGLKSDGTVVAVGWNAGQCSVGGWTDIIQIAAGEVHTVGLKSDGTVVAVGRNDCGQCNVGGWTNIVQVAAGDLHTLGLKSDGTVVAAGPEIELAKWNLI